VRNLTDRRPATIRRTETIAQAFQTLLRSETAQIFVVDEEELLLGVVTDYELLKAQLDGTPVSQCIDSLTSRNIAVTLPGANVAELLPMFREGRRQWAAVVENGRIVGQISRLDILRLQLASHTQKGLVADREQCSTQRPALRPRLTQSRERVAEPALGG
jgi:CBS domain-containing protein